MILRDLLLQPENLNWAWRKARRQYGMADWIFDQAELASFELNLEAELQKIREDFESGSYRMAPLRLLPQPKKPADDGSPRLRQSFQISVRDQVAWIAVANAFGPALDLQMPAWSYGHRLYRAAWYDDTDDGPSKLSIGPYRHSNGQIYRRFNQSWPLFRRHVALTARYMSTGQIDEGELDAGELSALRNNEDLSYLKKQFWRKSVGAAESVFYSSIDLRSFYPCIKIDAVTRGFDKFLIGFESETSTRELIKQMLDFKVSVDGLSEEIVKKTEPSVGRGFFGGVPTGLLAAGFMSNVAMLPVDSEVDQLLQKRRRIAHFRFVDDHSIVAFDFDEMCRWIEEYEGILGKHDIGARLASDKFDPKGLAEIYTLRDEERKIKLVEDVKQECAVDGRKSNKLMTRTLMQVSTLAASDFDSLTNPDKRRRLEQLEWLLLADIPDREIRSDTRAAFAAGRIATLAPTLFEPGELLVLAAREFARSQPSTENAEYKDSLRSAHRKSHRAWRSHTKRYFLLLFEAFSEHPDKVRLFIRLLQYCRITGYNGFRQITHWLSEQSVGDYAFLSRYLGALALQAIARNLIRSAYSCLDSNKLQSEQESARRYLHNVAKLSNTVLVRPAGQLNFFDQQSRLAFFVSLHGAAAILRGDGATRDEHLAKRLVRCAESISLLAWERGSSEWKSKTGYGLGVWTQFLESFSPPEGTQATPTWLATSAYLEPKKKLDWNNLRRYPSALPLSAWAILAQKVNRLELDDAGWLLEAAINNRASFNELPQRKLIVKKVSIALNDSGSSLLGWCDAAQKMESHDPRRGEWTALEIVKQLLLPLSAYGGSLSTLDSLHPANVVIPRQWFDLPSRADRPGFWTWEDWRFAVRTHARVKLTKKSQRIEDYRFGSSLTIGVRTWTGRLRSVGQLLWGILRNDFRLPGSWNIRGQERTTLGLIARDLERLAISSATLHILEACMLPRSQENGLLARAPGMFGLEFGDNANDTLFDPPRVPNVERLVQLIESAQRLLSDRQITVLHHKPRQLVPVMVSHVVGSTLSGAEGAEDDV